MQFIAITNADGNRGGEEGWRVEVDGKVVITSIDDLDIANYELDDLWSALNVDLQFDFEAD